MDQSGTQNWEVAIVLEGHRRFQMTGKLEKAYINCGQTCCSAASQQFSN